MKKSILFPIALLSASVYAVETIPSDAVITTNTEMTGVQTITDYELTVSKGATLTLKSGANLYINNETNLTNSTWTSPLNNSGTINVEAGATLKLAGQVNAATKAYQNKVGTINISGTVITDTPSTSPYNLYEKYSNITINQGGLLSITVNESKSARMGMSSSQKLTINSSATKKDGVAATGLFTSEFYLAYQNVNIEAARIVCGAKNAFRNLNGDAVNVTLVQNVNVEFDMQAGVTDLGTIALQLAGTKKMTFMFGEDKAGDVFDIASLTSNVAANEGNTTFTFCNFENDFIKIADTSNLSFTDDGKLVVATTKNDVNYAWTITLTGKSEQTIEGENVSWKKEFSDGWYISDDGFLNNTNVAVPEPAEWAMILGSIALCVAVYRRRK